MSYFAHRRDGDGATQSLEAHLLGVSNIAGALAAKLGLNEQGELLGLLHDLGKYSNEFQSYLGSAVGLINPDEDDYVDARGLKGKVDHSTAGAQLVWEEMSKQGTIGEIVGQILGLCIASHHSGLIDCLSSDTNRPVEDMFTKRISKRDDRTHLREAISDTCGVSGFARFSDRVWIETSIKRWLMASFLGPPGLRTECGLKCPCARSRSWRLYGFQPI